MDAIELLTRQHREVDTLFEQLAEAEQAGLPGLLDELTDALALHSAIEEEVFYPAVRGETTAAELGAAFEAHREMKRHLADLAGMSPSDEAFAARCRALEAFVREHVSSEETSLFPQVRSLFDDAVLDDLARRMEERLDELARPSSEERVFEVPTRLS
jgi:hemerythrin superfamily protein